jgi:hypothetical protein
MSVISLNQPTERLQQTATSGHDRGLRNALFLATFLLTWLTAKPFVDLSDPTQLNPVNDGNFLGQILATVLTVSLVAFAISRNSRLFVQALSPILVLTLAWFAFSSLFSLYPGLAARRLVLACFIIIQAAAFLLLPQGRDHFSRLLAVGALIVLVVCYFGVIFLPELSIHQAADPAEPDLAGNWRGFFSHKNGAGAGMAILIFIGIFVFRTTQPVLGALIIGLAAVFLVFTESKSPIRLLPLILIVSYSY